MKVPNSNKALTVLILLLINSCLCEINYQTVITTTEDQRGVASAPVSLYNIKSSDIQYNQQRSNESSSNLQNKRQNYHHIQKRNCVSGCGRCKIMSAPINPCGRCNRCNTGSYNIPSFNLNTISHAPPIQILNTIRKRQHEQTGTWNTKPINPIATTIQVKSSTNGMASVKATSTLGVTNTNYVIKPYSFVTTTNNIQKTAVNPFKLNKMLAGKNNKTTNVNPATTSVRNYFINTANSTFSKNHSGQTSSNSFEISLNSIKPDLTIVLPPLTNVTKYWGNCHRKTTVMPNLKTKMLHSTKSTAASRTKTTVIRTEISRNTTSRPKKIIPVLGPKTAVKTSSNCNITKSSVINTKCCKFNGHYCNFRTKITANNSKLNQVKPVNTFSNNSAEGKKRKSDTKFINNLTIIVPSDVKESADKTKNEKNKVKSTTKTDNSNSNRIKLTKTLDSNRNHTYTILGNNNKVKNGKDVVKNAIEGNNPDSQKMNKNNCPINNNNKISGQPITSHSKRNNIDDVKKLISKTLNKIKNMEIEMKKTNVEEVLRSNGNQSVVSTEDKNNNRVLKNNVEVSTAIQNKNVKTVLNRKNTDLPEILKNNGINSNKNLINKAPKEETKFKNNNNLLNVIKESVTKNKNGLNTAEGVLLNKNTTFDEATDVKNTNNVVKTETNKEKSDDTNNRINKSPNKSSPNISSDTNKPPTNGVPDEATKIKNGNKQNRQTDSKKSKFEWLNDVKLA